MARLPKGDICIAGLIIAIVHHLHLDFDFEFPVLAFGGDSTNITIKEHMRVCAYGPDRYYLLGLEGKAIPRLEDARPWQKPKRDHRAKRQPQPEPRDIDHDMP